MEPALLLDKLGQHSTARVRMNKGDAPTVRPNTRHGIDQANSGRLQTFQGHCEVLHCVRDMMHPLATLGEKTGDRTVRVSWSNQFDPARAGAKRGHLNRLLGQHEPLTTGKTKSLVALQRLIEVGHDHRNMVQSGIVEAGRSCVGANH
jgi:hypothetical protein